ncbi:MAG TPA: nuclear transport factor 2 family protein [Herbaspirillum sp.]
MSRQDPHDREEGIAAIVDAYFDGVYSGDATVLSALFDTGAQVYGEVDGQPYHKSVHAYLDGVAARKSPKELGEPFMMKTLSVDRLGSIANVKLLSPMLGFNYHLYLTLCLLDGQWRIVNKTFTNLPAGR